MKMVFANESAFEDHLRRLIDSHITSENPSVYALCHKTIGDIVVVRDGTSPAVFFVEVKYHQPSKSRVGIGTSYGAGIQPEILLKRPVYFETHLRWIIGSYTCRNNQFWFVTSDTLSRFISGGSIGKKQNNIQLRLFRDCPSIDEDQLVGQLRSWLLL